jgi:hypothetical protein
MTWLVRETFSLISVGMMVTCLSVLAVGLGSGL